MESGGSASIQVEAVAMKPDAVETPVRIYLITLLYEESTLATPK